MLLDGSLWRTIVQDDFVGNILSMYASKRTGPPKRAVCFLFLVAWLAALAGILCLLAGFLIWVLTLLAGLLVWILTLLTWFIVGHRNLHGEISL